MSRYIDADALKQWIKDVWDWDRLDDLTTSTVLRQTLSDIDDQPAADVPQWIPCNERLPIAPAFCLVTTDGSYNDVIDIAMYMSDGWHKASKVLAWMPLPEPWKGEADATQD